MNQNLGTKIAGRLLLCLTFATWDAIAVSLVADCPITISDYLHLITIATILTVATVVSEGKGHD